MTAFYQPIPPQDDNAEGQTLRLWLSDQQWMSLLSRIEQSRSCATPAEGTRRRDARLPATFVCMFRCKQRDGAAATFLVRSRNLSKGGLGFTHTQPLETGTLCTVAIQMEGGGGRMLGGRIAWCRGLESADLECPLYELGLQFDQPIDPNDLKIG